MRFQFTATLLMASATFGMAAKDPKPKPSACTPSQPDRSVPHTAQLRPSTDSAVERTTQVAPNAKSLSSA